MNLFIMPHPPLAIPEIGLDKVTKIEDTIEGMKKIANKIKDIAPKSIAVISPHGNVFSDGLCINIEDNLSGTFFEYNQPQLKLEMKGDFQKALILCSGLRASGINCLALDSVTAEKYDISTDLDYGVLVPMYFILKQYTDFRLLHINSGFLPKVQMYQSGKILADILGEDSVIIASGDLSHKLSKANPEEYDEMGAEYDKRIVESINNNEFLDILSTDEKLIERSGQCSHKPLEMLLGALDGYSPKGKVYSYEAPFGVGYMTAEIECIGTDKEHLLNQYLQVRKDINKKKKQREDEYVKLARDTIYYYVRNGKRPVLPDDLSEEMYINQRGVFVSIKREGKLRGCIGTMIPTKASVAEEIIDNAIEAATKDSRFTEVQHEELEELEIYVDVLSELENIESKEQLDINSYGVVVTKDYKRGLLLPNIEGVKNVEHQLSIALEKAGIKNDEDYSLQRFKVERHQRA